MILISHRGNTKGKNPLQENNPMYLIKALKEGYHIEVDIWNKHSNWFFGHDFAQYKIGNNKKLKNFCKKYLNKIWFHCKNYEALDKIKEINNINYFWHENDSYTITSKGFLWSYPGKKIIKKKSIILFPEKFFKIKEIKKMKLFGICSDYVKKFL